MISQKTRDGLVVYILGEGIGRFKLRLLAWCESKGLLPRRLARSFVLVPRTLNLLRPQDIDQFIETPIPEILEETNQQQVAMIIIDTWNRCVPGPESDETFSLAVQQVDRIREVTGATIVALHHSPKDGRLTARGSGVLEGAVDSMFVLKGDPAVKMFTFELAWSRISILIKLA